MKIDYIDGIRLRQGVIAGARRVILMQDHLNQINVFPVADSDTGTNMALTMQSIAESAINCRDESVSGMSQCLADAALMGARGNSGAILAQFFQGFAESFRGKVSASLKHFGEAVDRAQHSAFEAINEPREGTILTVIHDWAEQIEYQYCTECFIAGDAIDRLQLRDRLGKLGNSLIVAGSNEKVRVHVHTNTPERAKRLAKQLKREFEVRDAMIVNVSPALGVHAGPGAVGIAFIGE